jgi:hypothetical protein
MIVIVFIILLVLIFILFNLSSEQLLGTPSMHTDVYTITGNKRLSTESNVAQLWWQPVSYILNP